MVTAGSDMADFLEGKQGAHGVVYVLWAAWDKATDGCCVFLMSLCGSLPVMVPEGILGIGVLQFLNPRTVPPTSDISDASHMSYVGFQPSCLEL